MALPLANLLPIMFLARPEPDGSYTLIIDAPGTDTLPIELGHGFTSPDQITQALYTSLAAPAVAEDRMGALEDAAARVNQLIDAANEQAEIADDYAQRIATLESLVSQLQASAPAPAYARPQIPRIGVPQSVTPVIRQSHPVRSAPQGQGPQTPIQPQGRQPLRPIATGPAYAQVVPESRPADSFRKGEFQPHTPVGGVTRGPGSEG